MPLVQLVYASAALQNVSEDDFDAILAESRTNNGKVGITGILLSLEGTFLQVLEGEAEVVDTLYDKIGYDRRHGSVVLLLRRQVPERAFGDWSMGYMRLDRSRPAGAEGFFDILGFNTSFLDLKDDHALLKVILEDFKKGRWRRQIV